MPITDKILKRIKASDKAFKVFDERGLYLFVPPSGGKGWRLKYRFGGKEKLLSLGTYPEVSLKEARERRDEARKLLEEGIDPSAARKEESARKAGLDSFEGVSREWFEEHTVTMVPAHRKLVLLRLERNVFPFIGSLAVSGITPAEILSVVRRVQERGVIETARRTLGDISRIFRYSVATGRAGSDPSRDLRGALPPTTAEHFAAVTDPKRLSELLAAMDEYRGGPVVRAALRLAPLLVVRPGELRRMEWGSVNLETAEWRFQVTKTKVLHVVPLCRQAVTILRELQPLTGSGKYVFPGRSPDRPMSENGVLVALRALGFPREEMTGHGFRAVFRTLGDEILRFRVDLIEHQLAHNVRDPLGRAYNRTQFLDDRRVMMQRWADYLDELKAGKTPARILDGKELKANG